MFSKTFSDIIIVGAGVTGSSLLIKLIDEAIEKNVSGFSITIIDKNKELGPGLPFGTEQSAAVRMNTPVKGLNITLDEKHSFFNWLRTKDLAGDPEVTPLGINHTDLTIADHFAPRKLYGRYLKETVLEAIATARKNGITVNVFNNSNIEKINQNNDDSWTLQLEGQRTVVGDRVILATGHMPSEQRNLSGKLNYFDSPWQDLSNIDKNKRVIVLGSGLSAIDTAKILVANGHVGEIVFASSSGALPVVKPPQNSVKIKFEFLTPENLDKENLKLTEVIDLFTRDLEKILGKKINLEEIINSKQNPETWLSKQIEDIDNNIVEEWKIFLDEMYYHVLPYVVKNLSEADLEIFKHKYYGPYMKWAAGMPKVNAQQMLELIQKNQLKLVSDLYSVELVGDDSFKISFKDNKPDIRADYVINATGMGHIITDNPLLAQMVDKNYITSPKFGGIKTDPTTYQVKNPQKNQEVYTNLFAAGPPIFGSNPAVYAVESSAMAADVIATTLIAAISKQQIKENELQEKAHAANTTYGFVVNLGKDHNQQPFIQPTQNHNNFAYSS